MDYYGMDMDLVLNPSGPTGYLVINITDILYIKTQ